MNDRDRYLFFRKLASLLRAGVGLDRSLNLLAKHTGDEKQRSVIGEMARKVAEGAKLSDAMGSIADQFPEMERKIVSVGEVQNTLPQTLDRIGQTLETRHKWKMAHRGSTIYGVIMVIIALLIFLLFQIAILPMFRDTFQGLGNWQPVFTRLVLDVSYFTKKNAGFIFPVLILLVVAAVYWRARLDKFVSGLPWRGRSLSLIDGINFSQAFELGLESGLKIDEIMELASNVVRGSQLRTRLEQLKTALSQGEKLGPLLVKVHGFPCSIANLVLLGEQRGELGEAFREGVKISEDELESRGVFHFNDLALGLTMILLFLIILDIYAVYLPLLGTGMIYD